MLGKKMPSSLAIKLGTWVEDGEALAAQEDKMTEAPRLIVLRGLPASGKSTIAKQIVENENALRINKDLLREMMFFGYDPEDEKWVKWIETEIARIMLQAGKSIVVDDTNLKEIDLVNWQTFAEATGFAPPIVQVVNTPIDVCIDRDSRRPFPVGQDRIKEMAEQAELHAVFQEEPK